METVRSYRYRIYPKPAQVALLQEALTRHRWLYNAALEQRQVAYQQGRKPALDAILRRNANLTQEQHQELYFRRRLAPLWGRMLCDKLPKGLTLNHFGQTTEVKNVKRLPGFETLNSYSLGITLGRLDKAYKAFFKRGGFPKFKNARTFRSITYQFGNGAKLSEERLTIGRIGDLRVRWHRPLPEGAVLKQAVIRVEPSGHWYVSIQAQVQMPDPEPHQGAEVAMDLGVNQLAVLTDGETINAARVLERWRRKLRVQQRTMDRRKPKPGQPASKGYRAAQLAVARTHERIANARKDFNHKLSRELVRRYGKIYVEKLDIQKMVSDETTISKLNRGILDAAWGQLTMFLRYKAEETGCQVVEVDPAYTTQQCASCGVLNPRASSKKVFVCPHCGKEEPRKSNAARNVREKGKAVTTGVT